MTVSRTLVSMPLAVTHLVGPLLCVRCAVR